MKVTLLGTGTSQGVPVIGCGCKACTSTDPKDNRLRTSALIEFGDVNILIDTSPDLRQQMLRQKVEKVDAILYTHEHNDHVIGLDDIRPFNFMQKQNMPVYGLSRVLNEVSSRFAYVFSENSYPGAPRATLNTIEEKEVFEVYGKRITAIPVLHGKLPILGYRIGDFCFITDASYLTADALNLIKGSKFLVINALREESHPSHFTVREAIDVAKIIKPEKTFLSHISHVLGPTEDWSKKLPAGVFPAYDGLEIVV